jgi:hypothetical protein
MEAQYTPAWEGPIEGWSLKYAVRHVWRVAPEYSVDDLMAEAFLIFKQAEERYAGKAKNGAHFMALYKLCLASHITDLAWKRSKRKEVVKTDAGDDEVKAFEAVDRRSTDAQIDAELRMLVQEAPERIRRVITMLMEYSTGSKDKPQMRRRLDGTRETTNAYVCRLVGLDSNKFDVVTMIETYLAGVEA